MQEFYRLRSNLRAKQEHASLLDDFKEFDRTRLDLEEGSGSEQQTLLKERASISRSTGQVGKMKQFYCYKVLFSYQNPSTGHWSALLILYLSCTYNLVHVPRLTDHFSKHSFSFQFKFCLWCLIDNWGCPVLICCTNSCTADGHCYFTSTSNARCTSLPAFNFWWDQFKAQQREQSPPNGTIVIEVYVNIE